MKINGLSESYKDYNLAFFEYFATGEGVTVEAEILYKDQAPTIGFGEWKAQIIPFAIENELLGQKYLDVNLEFKARFLECFGQRMWDSFSNCCLNHKSVIDLKVQMYYNLS